MCCSGTPVIPVLMPGVAQIPESLLFMRQLHQVRFEESASDEAALRKLIWGITSERPTG